MALPGFTAELAVGSSGRSYGRSQHPGHGGARLLTPQEDFSDCSEDGVVCYDCYDDGAGCGCDWYISGHYVVSSDCGTG
jgi:hypothetical protein